MTSHPKRWYSIDTSSPARRVALGCVFYGAFFAIGFTATFLFLFGG